ncbi:MULTISPECIES: alpha/beta hydrolase [Bacillaceae]|uniref:Alpha/beta hydrolase n=1 Tax=Evansella alkalicola TaxID=745819 RepID=A0ABS6JXW3_9BACI|nr:MULTISPECIES: alpha/beta hydrolase [Bacillaceae]MBU9723443.1 alpha/beta hydrolase [Bacillus alkalicola]
MKTDKLLKTVIDVVGFPFTLTNMYFNKKRKIREIGLKLEVNDKYVHTIISGEKDAEYTVILDAGLSCCSLDWHYIQPQVSQFARVISFDRAGYGWSSAYNEPYTSLDVVNDLINIIKGLQIKPPYILVGHSFGSLNMRLFASMYPEYVASLILIDPVHEKRYLSNEWDSSRKKSHKRALNVFRFGFLTSGIGLPKLLKQSVGRKFLPEPFQKYADYVGYQPKSYEAVYNEFLFSEKSALQLMNSQPLNATLPVTILSSNNSDPTWVEHQTLLDNLTENTIQIKTNNQHSIHLENPDVVIDAIKEAVNQANTKTPSSTEG